ncbi:DUF6157 family protein [Moheibacter sediminis]|uniref:Uncharacterized protein n=1 Tax=Moheibacter sediminis TaxID=1434700 RepID=A0A1W2B0I1_9FLAO|nr:DUF6157 family protein [Moheibacter sediminis]SMC66449.1 hypothetical protein SAMN06296427_105225 [Moheibacter sediminis]
MHTTNYYNTFIEVSEDCPVFESEIPQQKGDNKSVALLQFEMISHNPYKYTSDEVLFNIYVLRNNLSPNQKEKEKFFSKGQACLRASPLGKRYGWGIHFDENGRMALYNLDSPEYQKLKGDISLTHLKAMRNKRR